MGFFGQFPRIFYLRLLSTSTSHMTKSTLSTPRIFACRPKIFRTFPNLKKCISTNKANITAHSFHRLRLTHLHSLCHHHLPQLLINSPFTVPLRVFLTSFHILLQQKYSIWPWAYFCIWLNCSWCLARISLPNWNPPRKATNNW